MSKQHSPEIAVVCGGPSPEAVVSRSSGNEVAKSLKNTFDKVHLIELDRSIAETLNKLRIEVVFPVLHGPPGEDETIQGLLELLQIPYVGNGVLASACAMNKVVAKHLFRAHGLRVAKDSIVRRSEELSKALNRVETEVGIETVIKPASQGSALGVAFASNAGELERALKVALQIDSEVLVEERVVGKEITAAVLERNGVEVLPIIEIRTPPGSWYDYEHRYTPGLSEHIVPAPLPKKQYDQTAALAKGAHLALGCRDLSRCDFVVPEQGEPVLLELNTLPGMTPTSLYPDAARAAGISFDELTAYLIQRALARRV